MEAKNNENIFNELKENIYQPKIRIPKKVYIKFDRGKKSPLNSFISIF